MVTCRYAGYDDEVRLPLEFLELHLRPLEKEQAEQFIRTWYRLVELNLAADREEAAAQAERSANELIERLREPDFRSARVFSLTHNPLLLANLCLVDRGGRLPHRRSLLCAECIDVLLETWRGAKEGLSLGMTAEEGRRALRPVAFWLHSKDKRTQAPGTEIEPVLEEALRSLRWKGGSARDFLERVRDESGLLTGWSDQRYGFMHLGFQEYLAALDIRGRHLEGEDSLAELASHHGESWWQEVALLLVALDEPSLFEPYLSEVVELDSFAEHPEALDLLLEDTYEVSERPFLQVLETCLAVEADRARQRRALHALELLDSNEVTAARERTGLQHTSTDLPAGRPTFQTQPGGVLMVHLPGGSFVIGSPETEQGRFDDEGPQRKVEIEPFAISRYAVTNEQYAEFLRADSKVPELDSWGDRQYNQARQPVVGVSWREARAFCQWVGGRLPSEAEWEYAARAGTVAPYLTGATPEDLDRFARYAANSDTRLHPVGEKEPNAWTLHDMLGNVWEWCEDEWHGNYKDAPSDGSAWVDQRKRSGGRVLRGGAFDNPPENLRVAARYGDDAEDRDGDVGFRVVSSGGR